MTELVSPCCGAEYNDDNEIFKCETCKNEFDEPELDYEYDERMLESKSELNDDERRDLGQ